MSETLGVVLPCDLPIVQAPMAGGPSTPALTAAVANAGGYGTVAAGYLAVLEGNPSSLGQLSNIRSKNGLPAEGFRTMVKHARLDPHHRDEMFAQLDELPLTATQSELIALSAFHSIEHLTLSLEEILDSHRSQRKAS